MDDATSAWAGPVVIYDRCPTIHDEHLDGRIDACRAFAAARGAMVAAEHVDTDADALIDGPDAGRRPELAAAIRSCAEYGAYLLVWHPDRLSHHAAGRAPIIEALSGRVLHSRGGLVGDTAVRAAA